MLRNFRFAGGGNDTLSFVRFENELVKVVIITDLGQRQKSA